MINHSCKKQKKVDVIRKSLLDSAIAVYKIDGALFHVYRAKSLHSLKWESAALKRLVAHARDSYLRYGSVPPFDKYDNKSAVYITRVQYTHRCKTQTYYPIEEWLSMRFIPSDGLPEYTEDLLFSLCEGKPLVDWLKAKCTENTEKIVDQIITLSRICSIPPCINGIAVNQNVQLPLKLQYTGISFALMNKVFLEEYKFQTRHRYITGMFREELINRVLTLESEQGRIPQFTYGYEFIGQNDPSVITLNRSSAPVYDFPAYFLKTDQHHDALYNLWKKGSIATDTFAYYVKTDFDVHEWMDDIGIFQQILPKLGALLTAKGFLSGSSITGEQMRLILNDCVDDGPQLRMMQIEVWSKSIEQYLRLCGIV